MKPAFLNQPATFLERLPRLETTMKKESLKNTQDAVNQRSRKIFNSILTLPPKFFLLFTPSHKVFQPIVKRYFYTATPVSTQ